MFVFFSSRRRHTKYWRDWSSDVCSSDLNSPLDKVVSGGELSRIMLSLKTVFVDKDEIPSVIFDEIDTGISGRIAQRVAEKMYLISKGHQVFCVTHLPQIASMSDNHFLVSKDVKNGKTDR